MTGQIIAGGSAGAYVNTQIQLVTDYTVAGKVAEQIGWFTDPNLIKAFQSRSSADQRDFPHWLADIVSANTKAKPLEGSNILEISYTANTARGAQAVAGALLKAYMDATLEQRHEDAERNAVWYEEQTAKAKQCSSIRPWPRPTYEKGKTASSCRTTSWTRTVRVWRR